MLDRQIQRSPEPRRQIYGDIAAAGLKVNMEIVIDVFRQQVHDFLSGVTLEIKAEVRLKPSPTGPKPEIDADLDVKTTPKEEPAP